jgi:hypothetical protein
MNFDINNIPLQELVTSLEDLPPFELALSYWCGHKTWHDFLNFRVTEHLIRERLNAFFLGEEPPTIEDKKLDGFIAAMSQYDMALYSLIFEGWKFIMPAAVKADLLLVGEKPRDCFRLIKLLQYRMFFENGVMGKNPQTPRAVYTHSGSAFSHNNFASAIETLTPIALAKFDGEILADDRKNPALLNLVHDAAFSNRSESPSLDLAATNYRNAAQSCLTAVKRWTHHGNTTR